MSDGERNRVVVTFNGAEQDVEYQPHAAVEALLQHAKQVFGQQGAGNQHVLALFTENGVELQDQQSAEDAGIKPGMLLILRPSAVRGGV